MSVEFRSKRLLFLSAAIGTAMIAPMFSQVLDAAAAKSTAKPAAKTSAKAPVKAAPKATQKPAAKPTAKPPTKPTAKPAAVSTGSITDISSQPYKEEIVHAVRLKLFQAPGGKFGPGAIVTGKELSGILTKAAKSYPTVFKAAAAGPTGALTREKAVTMVAQSLVQWDNRQAVEMEINATKDPLRYFYEDNGFKDGKSVSKPAREAYAIAIYDAIVPDTATLQPTAKCNRAYAAALVARAIPGNDQYTGLLLDCGGGYLPAAGGVRVKLEKDIGNQKVFIWPIASRMPSRTFSQAPGLASINTKEDIVKMRRCGDRPLVIKAERVEGNLNVESAPAIVISDSDADKLADLAKSSLILQTWRVGVCNYTRIKPALPPF